MMHSVRRSVFALKSPRIGRAGFALVLLVAFLISGCARKDMPYHGFGSSSQLDQSDSYVLAESVGGKLDPRNMSQEDQRYSHDNIAYDRNEEGYYQWGMKIYAMGYRDEYYVRELAPRAFRKELLDIYDKAIQAGYEEAERQATKQ